MGEDTLLEFVAPIEDNEPRGLVPVSQSLFRQEK